LFAPGDLLISSVATSTGNPDNGTANTDSRNASFYVGRGSGTSMAAAQVTGILACLLEALPTMTPAQALDIIKNNVTKYQIPQDTNDIYYSDVPISNTTPTYFSGRVMNTNYLLGAPNKYAVLKKIRPSIGEIYPPEDYLARPSTGILYPRPNIRIVT
jgi:subtilisin family serine protease